jgi:hypothetical protein
MRMWIIRTLILVAVCVAGYLMTDGVYTAHKRFQLHIGNVRAQSVTIVPRTVVVSENGKLITRATRSDGSYVVVRQVERAGESFLAADIHFIQEKKIVRVIGDIKATETAFPSPSSPTAAGLNLLNPTTSCKQPFVGTLPEPQVIGEETMLGYEVIHLKSGVIDQWLAPDLGCEELKSELNATTNAGKAVTAERIATSVVLGEPNPALFTIPADYTEMSPVEVDQAIANRYFDGKMPAPALQPQQLRSSRYAQFGPHGQFAPKQK